MSDEHLRELERRFGETGAPEDEAAWLRAQLHAGLVSENELRLRAYDEDEAARLALGSWRDDTAWSKALKEQQDRLKAERLTRAKEEAAERGKEPFDLEAFARAYAFSDEFEEEHYRDYADDYEYRYYVRWPKIMSIVEFARHQEELDRWD